MPKVIGLSGSLRRGSYNATLLRAATVLAPEELTIEIESIRAIPLYDGDVEADPGPPPAVKSLKDRIAEADGLLLVTPEHNNSIPGVFKNAIDWLSRPASDIPRVFGEKPVGIIGATPGRGGTILSQAAWLPVLRTLGTALYTGERVQISGAANVFEGEDGISDPKIKTLVTRYLAGFTAFVSKHARAK